MATKRNSFEGGTNGTAITAANSGGTSGDAFTVGVSSGLETFSNTHAHGGTLSCKLPTGSFERVGWDTLTSSDFFVRMYAWIQANAAGSILRLWDGAGAAGTYYGGFDTKVNGNLDLKCGVATVDVVGAIALNQWIRIEGHWSTTTGAECRLYNTADSDTATVIATTATVLPATIVSQEFARGVSSDMWIDDLMVTTDGWPGPAVDPPPRPPIIRSQAGPRSYNW